VTAVPIVVGLSAVVRTASVTPARGKFEADSTTESKKSGASSTVISDVRFESLDWISGLMFERPRHHRMLPSVGDY